MPSRRASTHHGKLFLFDEPTTGLHFEDVAKLLRAFRKLLAAGHSLLVIEHNLDVIRAADWIIDLGPEGGDAGGEIVVRRHAGEMCERTPARTPASALADYEAALASKPPRTPSAAARRARAATRTRASATTATPSSSTTRASTTSRTSTSQIPRDCFTVVTGVSGSGKSTLAFDILFAEGQRRYLESLNAYARQFVQPAARPDVDAIYGIPPTVAIEQRTSRGGRKSTVATLTEIYHFLRLLYVKLGTQYCPDCDVPIEPQSVDVDRRAPAEATTAASASRCSRRWSSAARAIYTDLAKWAREARASRTLRVDGEHLPTKHGRGSTASRSTPSSCRWREIDVDAARPRRSCAQALGRALELGKGVRARRCGGRRRRKPCTVFSTKRACPSCGRSFPELDPRLFSYNSKHGWCDELLRHGPRDRRASTTRADAARRSWLERLDERRADDACPACDGQRLNPVALAVRFRDASIARLAAQPIAKIARRSSRS